MISLTSACKYEYVPKVRWRTIRRCLKCFYIKGTSEFLKGKNSVCKGCFEFKKNTFYEFENGEKYKLCSICEKLKLAKEFRGKNGDCIECSDWDWGKDLAIVIESQKEYFDQIHQEKREKLKEYGKQYRLENPYVIKANTIRRRTIEKKLPNNLDKDVIKQIYDDFNGRCMLTGSKDVELDHFIALSTGHCGSYYGNMILLDHNLNRSKSNKNPLEWILSKDKKVVKNFNKLIEYLARINLMKQTEYIEFINWCFNNKREVDREEVDCYFSIKLWKNSNK